MGVVWERPWRPKFLNAFLSRGYSSDELTEENDRPKWEDEGTLKDSTQLKAEFEAACRGFSNISEAIRELPKMNPNGKPLALL